jgi:GNAT superfamily N-acetyltransferase
MVVDALSPVDCNYLDANRVFMGSSDTGEYLERRDVAIASCGLPVQDLNWGFLKPPYQELEATAAAVRSYFTGRKLPFQLTFRQLERQRIQKLEAMGWHLKSDPTPGMTLALPASIPEPPGGLAVIQVRTTKELVAFREAAFRGFGHPVAAAHMFLNERLLALPQVRAYSGLVEGAVVATSILVATGYVAGIYWVATLESHRRQGYGAALTWAAVGGGRDFGCTIASLQASKLGRRVYARMGFEHVLDYVHLLPPEE